MDANTKHLLKLWAVVLPFCAFVITTMVIGLVKGARKGELTPYVAVLAAALFVTVTILLARRRTSTLFQEPSADRAITYYHRSVSAIPNAKAMAAYLSAFAAVTYGEFDRARYELAAVNWASLPPMYQGFETYIHSLLAIFEARDYSRALSFAEEVRELGTVDSRFPGAGRSRIATEANIAVCQLLLGNHSVEILDQLEKGIRKLPGIAPALPAWAMATHYLKMGSQTYAEKYIAIVQRLLPHSILLRSFNSGATAKAAQ